MNKILIGLWLSSNLIFTPKLLAQTFSFTDSPNDAHNVGGQNFEIYNTSWIDLGDRIRIVFDTEMPLEGFTNRFAVDGHIGWGDINMTNSTTGQNYGLVFSNQSSNPLGIYNSPGWTSLVQSNYGEPSLYNHPTSTIDSTGDKIGDVEVFEYKGEGINGSNRIAIEFSKDNLPFGDYMVEILQECANDLITFKTSVLEAGTPEIIEGGNVFVPSGHSTGLGNNISGLKTDGGGATLGYVIGGAVVVAALIIILSGGSKDKDNNKRVNNPNNPDKKPDKVITEIPESNTAYAVILLGLILLISRKFRFRFRFI